MSEEGAQSCDHISRAAAVANCTLSSFSRAVHVGRLSVQHSHTGAGVGDDARQRLIDLMRDRSRQSSQTHDPRYVREF